MTSGRKITQEEFIERSRKLHGSKYNYTEVEYINCTTKVIIICPIHGKFLTTPSDHTHGLQGCPKCGVCDTSSKLKLSIEEFIERARKVHGSKYNYIEVIYKNNRTKVKIICPIHGDFEQTPSSHLCGQGCPKCGRKRADKNITKTREQFIKDSKHVFGDRYIYTKVKYINSRTEVTIICKDHGEFVQFPSTHLRGSGCPKCGLLNGNMKKLLSTEEFIDKAKKIHGTKYDYTEVKYIDNATKVKIICPIHGSFEQTPNNHYQYGCNQCGRNNTIKSRLMTEKQFIENAKLLHNNKYTYELVEYKRLKTKVKIICPTHGIFEQSPRDHLRTSGCQKCTTIISKPESLWLNMLNIPDDKEHRQVSIRINKNKLLRVDGYDPNTKTIYEFHGDYWHGNPKVFPQNKFNNDCHKTFGELYKKTKQKERLIRKSGYKLVTMWEYDFKKLIKRNKLINKRSSCTS